MLPLSLPELSLHMNWSSTTNLSLSSLNEACQDCLDMWLPRKPWPKEVGWAHYEPQELIRIRRYMSDPRLGDRHALALLIWEYWVQVKMLWKYWNLNRPGRCSLIISVWSAPDLRLHKPTSALVQASYPRCRPGCLFSCLEISRSTLTAFSLTSVAKEIQAHSLRLSSNASRPSFRTRLSVSQPWSVLAFLLSPLFQSSTIDITPRISDTRLLTALFLLLPSLHIT